MRPTAKGGAQNVSKNPRPAGGPGPAAEVLHCTQVCYSHYEIGKRDIPTRVLVQLAAFYGTSTDYLLGLTDEPTPYPRAREKQDP